jgi:ABC-2 type transport system ATP-binding protein/lipopolysaccharide transport system ATP-binding protein
VYEIAARDLCVEFPIYDGRRSLRHALVLDRVHRKTGGRPVGGAISESRGQAVVNALHDITFTLRDGDRVGLIGHNGAGKSTLLRALAGIYEPISGELRVVGKVMPLFSLAVAIDMDSTGIEAIRTRGLMLGLDPATIEETMEEIANFTELGEYLYMPMRTYSAGMLARLAFAVATSLRPEILLMDEVIGAGDAAFIERAQDRLQQFMTEAGIIVVASHHEQILRRWCNKAMLLHKGRLVALDETDAVIAAYHRIIGT